MGHLIKLYIWIFQFLHFKGCYSCAISLKAVQLFFSQCTLLAMLGTKRSGYDKRLGINRYKEEKNIWFFVELFVDFLLSDSFPPLSPF